MAFLIYEGPSTLDNAPIFAALTGIDNPSRNQKTGPMAQLYYLRSDVSPIEAIKSGEDASICGQCPHRGGSCYVNAAQGPTAVYKAYKAGKYTPIDPEVAGRNRSIRIGAYGDSVIQVETLERLVSKARMWTGYTHQMDELPELKGLMQASVETPEQAELRWSQGWKTFRTKLPDEPLLKGELYCPSDKGIQCIDCQLCNGRKKNIAIDVHGVSHKLDKYKKFRMVAASL